MTGTVQAPSTTTRAPIVIFIAAVLAAIAGFVLVAKMAVGAEPVVDLQTEATSGDLSVWVDRYEWLGHNHGAHDHGDDAEVDETQQQIDDLTAQAEVFAMPQRMMPGTPDEGFQRLQIEMNVLNRGDTSIDVRPDDFRLEAADGRQWLSLLGGTFSVTTLGSGHAVSTVVAFDVPEDDSTETMYLVWTSDGDTARFALNGSGHAH